MEGSDNETGLNLRSATSEISAMEESVFNSVIVSHKQSVHTESKLRFENTENIEREEYLFSEFENLNVSLKDEVCNRLRKDDFHETNGNDTSLKFEPVAKEDIVYGASALKLNTRENQSHNVYESSLNFTITTNGQIVDDKQIPLSLQVMANEQSEFGTKVLIAKYVGNFTRNDNDNNKNIEIDEYSIIKSDNFFNYGPGESDSVLTPCITTIQKDGDEILNVKPISKLTDEIETKSEVVVESKVDRDEYNLKSDVQENTEYFLQNSSVEVDIQDRIENTSEEILNIGGNESNYNLGSIQTEEYVVVRARQIWIEEDDLIEYVHSPFLIDTERESDVNRDENEYLLVDHSDDAGENENAESRGGIKEVHDEVVEEGCVNETDVKEMKEGERLEDENYKMEILYEELKEIQNYKVNEVELEEGKQNREEEELGNRMKIHEGESNKFQMEETEEEELEDERKAAEVELYIQEKKTEAEMGEANENKEEEEEIENKFSEYEEEQNKLQTDKTEKETGKVAEYVVEEGLDFNENKSEAEIEAHESEQELENRAIEQEEKQRDEVEREVMEVVVEHERELAESVLEMQGNKTEENFDHQANVVEEFTEEVKKETEQYQIEESDECKNEMVEEEQIEKSEEIREHKFEEEPIQDQSLEIEEEENLDDVFYIPVEDTLSKTGPPEPPAGRPSVAPSETSVSVAWSSPPYDGGCVLTGYRVEMKTDTDEEWNVVAERCHSLSRVIRGLTTGQTYTFRVRAENIHGASEPSSESIPIKLGYIEQEEEEDMPTQLEPCHVEIQAGEEFLSRYTVHEELGKGRYGVVHKVTDQKTGNTMAAKFVRCIKKQDREKVQEEIDIMNCLRHPKLLQLVAAFDNPKDIVMIMEYISGGELFERVVADDFTLTEKDCIIFMRQICEGVDYMHKNLVVHLDLKPENIMCRTRTSHQIKLIDFGLAQQLNPDSPVRVLFGTPEFIPPEIINYEPIGVESDMWSVGVICYVLLSGLSPFMGDNDAETFANITRADYDFDDEAFDAISQDAKDFISELLEKRRDKRLTAAECFGHKWMTQCDTTMSCVKLCTDKLKKFIIRRKWQKTGNAIRALGRMATLSAASRRNSSASSTSNSPRPSLSSGAASRMSSLNEEEVAVQSECNGKSNRVRMCSERSDSGISDCSSINPPPQTCTCPNKPLLSKKFSISEETESETNDTKLSQVNRLNNISKPKLTSTPKLSKLHSPFLNNKNNNTEGLNGSSSSKVTSDLSPTAKIRTTNRVRAFPESSSPKPSSGTLQKDAKLLQKNENFQKAFAFWKG